jgi:hypothetical protein
MPCPLVFRPVLLLAALAAVVARPLPAAACEGLVEIFNGKDLDGWIVEGSKEYKEGDRQMPVWSVEDGMIVCSGKGFGFLRYDKPLGDFLVRLEYRMSKGCNSGIGIRTVEFTGPASTRPSYAAYEIQILDDAGRPPSKHSSGSLYRYVAPALNATKPAGEWNAMEIECRGPKIKITLNGEVIHDIDQSAIPEIKDKPLEGYFSLQNHSRPIEFRNVKLKEL